MEARPVRYCDFLVKGLDVDLWLEKYDDFVGLIERVHLEVRNVLCVDVVEQSLEYFKPSFEEKFSQVTIDYVHAILPELRRFAQGNIAGFSYGRLVNEIYGMEERDNRIGIAGIVGALAGCVESLQYSPTVEHVVEVLSAGYQAVLATEGIPRITLESERADPNLVRLVQAQLDLVRSFE